MGRRHGEGQREEAWGGVKGGGMGRDKGGTKGGGMGRGVWASCYIVSHMCTVYVYLHACVCVCTCMCVCQGIHLYVSICVCKHDDILSHTDMISESEV